MAITVGLFGQSGSGKTTSLVIDKDGKYDPKALNFANMVLIHSDKKELPFSVEGLVEGKNLFSTADVDEIIKMLKGISDKGPNIKSIVIDTINNIMVEKEMLERRKLNFDQWMDLARDIFALITVSNTLRKDLIVYLLGHVTNFTDVDGNESKCLITNGRKLEKIKLESKLPVVLMTGVERKSEGKNEYYFETQANRSTAKSPIGMFSEFKIPNSLSLVDFTIRQYYKI
jgi:hypothetical protein